MRKIIFVFITILINLPLNAQDFVFFSNSPSITYYDWSWGFVNAPSVLERIGEKFPVDTIHFYSPANSLRLKWTSKPGGDWGFAIAEIGTPWPVHNITTKDSLAFWAYSDEFIDSLNLPLIYLEDNTNKKTPKVSMSVYAPDIQPNTWTKIQVPVNVFVSGPDGANLQIIKTIFYGQDLADDVQRTLYLDEIRMITSGSSSDTIPPAVPQSLTAYSYERHIDLKWIFNSETDLAGYNIYRLNGTNYSLIGTASKDDKWFTDFLGAIGMSGTYKITAYDFAQNESPLSDEVTASTRSLTDDEMLTMVQEASFRYFWDYAHPVSGLIRERSASGNTVTIGGSGFGVMAILVGIQRGFITRNEGIDRMLKILNFLTTHAIKFYGAFPHWMDGETGEVKPFSQYDDGADLVETAFLIQGLLAAREFFNENNTNEFIIRTLITQIWEEVEWDWFRKEPNSNFLYWHWSPNYQWQINFRLIGWNETMITYLLGIASPTHKIPASMYHNGWASSPNYLNGRTFYNIPLYVGWDNGGPLFFTHYSFLGFDPSNKKDAYTNYFINNRNTTLINRAYCIDNPENHLGYGENSWGLTASDDPLVGYLAHEPTAANDNGTLTPTAALSSMPYTPTESMNVLLNFYRTYGENLWGPYGFKDAFNLDQNWFAESYLAIDQGPIVVMIENYRSGLLWEKFMANPEIQPMLDSIGFVFDPTDVNEDPNVVYNFELNNNYPNPFNPSTTITFNLPSTQQVELNIYNVLGKKVKQLINNVLTEGEHKITWDGTNDLNEKLPSGVYVYSLRLEGKLLSKKMILQK